MEGPRRKNWSPEISSAFWVAYSALCDLLKPVTIDTIEASRSKIKAHKFIFFGPLRTISLTQRTARRYLILLLVLLVISTVSGFIVSVSNSLSTEIKALVGDGDTYVTQTAAGLRSKSILMSSPMRMRILCKSHLRMHVSSRRSGRRSTVCAADCRICIMSKIECIRKSS